MMAGRMRGNAAIPQWLELLCCLKNAIMEWPGGPGSDSDSAAFAFLPPIVEGPRPEHFQLRESLSTGERTAGDGGEGFPSASEGFRRLIRPVCPANDMGT